MPAGAVSPESDAPPVPEHPSDEPKADPTPAAESSGPEGEGEDPFADPFEDPFSTEAETGARLEEYDPWEAFNIQMFAFNRKLDQYVIKPVAIGYDFILPDPVELGIQNFFQNVRFVPRFMNNLLQAKFKGAGVEIGRFVINTTIGLAGFFDPATHWFGLETPYEDWGQTLGAYGLGPGPYLVLPFLPPLTVRDATGFLFMDVALDPVNYFVFLVMPYRFEGQPVLLEGSEATTGYFGARVFDLINERSINLEKFQGVDEATLDLYSAVRNAYLQKRAAEVAR
ncbi:MAG: MlaA family lipoprotein [bacterium]